MNINIEYERRFIEFFDFKIVNSNKQNEFIIVDSNNINVGNIVATKYKNTTYFHTKINTNNIIYDNTRKDNYTSNTNSNYEFDIINNNKINHVEIGIENQPYITITKDNKIIFDFCLYDERLFFKYNSETENYDIEETTIIEINNNSENEIHKGKEYNYSLSFNNKEKKDNKKEFDLIVKKHSNKTNKLFVIEQTSCNKTSVSSNKTIVDGNIVNVIEKHQMGIDSFKHFRYLINQILPFKNEVLQTLLGNRKVTEEPFTLFFEEYKSNIKLSNFQEIYKITDDTILAIKKHVDDNDNVYCTGNIIHNDKIIFEFIPIITQTNEENIATGNFSWNENYIFTYMDDGLVGQVFDVNCKTNIIDNYTKNKLFNIHKNDKVNTKHL